MNKKWKIILILSLIGNLFIVYVAIKALEYRAHINEFLDKYTYVVNEFSRRDRYTNDNKALISDTLVPGRVVFLGTQVTERWNLKKYFPDFETINRGIFGQRVSGFLLRFRPDVIDLYPRAVVIEVSSYNFRPESSVREIEEYTASMIDLARANGITPIPTTVIPPVKDSSVWGNYYLVDSLGIYNRWLKDYCAGKDIDCADFNSALSDSGGYLPDGLAAGAIDLNEEGYKIISDVAAPVIEKYISIKSVTSE